MRKIYTGIIIVMIIASYSLMKVLLHYANKPAEVNTIAQIEDAQEETKVLDFIRMTHESYNDFLNYGKAENYTEGDWNQFKQWFQQQEPSLKNIHKEIENEKIKRDVNRSYEIVKKDVELQNIEYVVYAHRVYHDLDIFVNKYKGETNVWGYTEFGDGQNIQVIKQAIQTK
nr:hypothetical protein [Bacillus cereus]